MFENLFSTKMSASKKTLLTRFEHIRTKNKLFSKLSLLIISITLSIIVLCAVLVSAFIAKEETDGKIALFYEGEKVEFEQKPFFENNTLYLPMAELFELLELDDKSKIEEQGESVYIHIDGHENSYAFSIGVPEIVYEYDYLGNDNRYKTVVPFASVRRNGEVFIPFEYIEYIINRYNFNFDFRYQSSDIDSNVPYHDNAEFLTYSDICEIQLKADRGEEPWRFAPLKLISYFVNSIGKGETEFLSYSETETQCDAVCLVDGKSYIVKAIKPIDRSQKGIWIIEDFREFTLEDMRYSIDFWLPDGVRAEKTEDWYKVQPTTWASVSFHPNPMKVIVYFLPFGEKTEGRKTVVGQVDNLFEQNPSSIQLSLSKDVVGHLQFVLDYGRYKVESDYFNVIVTGGENDV